MFNCGVAIVCLQSSEGYGTVTIMREQRFSPKQLYQARLKRDHSQSTLAAALQHRTQDWSRPLLTSQSKVSDWETGRNAPADRTIRVLAAELGQSIEYFYSSGAEEEDDEEAAAMPSHLELLDALRPIAALFNREREIAA
jgi:transcriptional regulator with XRE-family HTH domain